MFYTGFHQPLTVLAFAGVSLFSLSYMKVYEPLAVALFVVVVLTSSYMLGKRIGYDEGWEKANSDAIAEGQLAGFNDALNTVAKDSAGSRSN